MDERWLAVAIPLRTFRTATSLGRATDGGTDGFKCRAVIGFVDFVGRINNALSGVFGGLQKACLQEMSGLLECCWILRFGKKMKTNSAAAHQGAGCHQQEDPGEQGQITTLYGHLHGRQKSLISKLHDAATNPLLKIL